jgi:hypothetical protein
MVSFGVRLSFYLLTIFLVLLTSAGRCYGGFSLTLFPLDQHNAKIMNSQKSDLSKVGEKFLFSGEGAVRKFKGLRSNKALSQIYFPVATKEMIAEQLGFSRNDVEEGWFAVLTAKVRVPASGDYRFVGLGDGLLVVRANGKAVLDARSTFYAPEKHRLDISYLSDGAGVKNRSLRAGGWIPLKKGAMVSLEVMIGTDEPNGAFYLMLDKKGSGYPTPTEQGGAYPLFVIDQADGQLPTGHAGGGIRNPPIVEAWVFPQYLTGEGADQFIVKSENNNFREESVENGRREGADLVPHERWSGDFHLKKSHVGKARGHLTLWVKGEGRGNKWEFEVAKAPETSTQSKTTNYFTYKGVKLEGRVDERRGKGTSRAGFLKAQMREDKPRGEKLLPVSLSYEFDAFTCELVPGKGEKVPPLGAEERRANLDKSYPFDLQGPEAKKWISENGLVRQKGERDLAFANRVQIFMTQYFTYNSDRGLSFKDAFRYRGIACGGAALLFSSIMRHNDIPARIRGGRWLQSQHKAGDGGYALQVHVKTDFYAEGIGWVCVEFPYGEKDASKITEILGKDGGFLTMHINPFVTSHDFFILDQGFRLYSNGNGVAPVYEWWEAEVARPSGEGELLE